MRQLVRRVVILAGLLGGFGDVSAAAYIRTPGFELQADRSAITVLFVNGIGNDAEKAIASSESLIQVMKTSGLPQLKYSFSYFYNTTDGFGGDLAELKDQAVISDTYLSATNGDRNQYYQRLGAFYNTQLGSIDTLTSARKRIVSVTGLLKQRIELTLNTSAGVVLVPHSQGNFYVEAAYAMLWAEGKAALLSRIRVTGVASVAATSPNYRYITHTYDHAIQAQNAQAALLNLGSYRPLPANETPCIDSACGSSFLWEAIDPLVHGFTEVYLNPGITSQATRLTFPKIIFDYVSVSLAELGYQGIPAQYTITDLGSLPDINPTAINNRGDVVGQCGLIACIRLRDEQNWRLLGTLGGTRSIAFGINSTGHVVGNSLTDLDLQYHAFEYSGVLGSPLVDLAPDIASVDTGLSQAMSIADSGFITGYVYSPDASAHAFLLRSGVAEDLGTLPGRLISFATSVNNSGMVVGRSWSPGVPTAFVRSHGANEMREINQLSGKALSEALWVNSSGTVVGYFCESVVVCFQVGFIYSKDPQTGIETFTEIRDQNFAVPATINDLDEVVGGNSTGAFVYYKGNIRDLNQLIPANSGWRLGQGIANNNLGMILGKGTLNGQDRSFLLTPVR